MGMSLIASTRQWTNPFLGVYSKGGMDINFDFLWRTGTFLDLDSRINFFTNYYSVSPGMASKVAGKGAGYLVGFRDSDGDLYLGEKNYRLHLPAGVPAAIFWSLTLYDALTASGLANGQSFPSLGSRDNPVANGDGSVDLYLGSTAPAGEDKNWLGTVPGKGYAKAG